MNTKEIPPGDLLQLKRLNTPTVYNGWEAITRHDPSVDGFNLEETTDFMPEMGAMVGFAVTLVIEPSRVDHRISNPNAVAEYREYLASVEGPKIVVVQDLDKPRVIGSFWGEVNANIHRALGCVGTITDGGIRDLDEMHNAGFKALARQLCVGHAYVHPARWNCPVEVFGRRITPGQLIHADKHGFLAVPDEDQSKLLEAALEMDKIETRTLINAARNVAGKTMNDLLQQIGNASEAFGTAVKERFHREGEW